MNAKVERCNLLSSVQFFTYFFCSSPTSVNFSSLYFHDIFFHTSLKLHGPFMKHPANEPFSRSPLSKVKINTDMNEYLHISKDNW